MARYPSVGLVVVFLLCMGARPAEAYIDPGNTSMVVQLVVGSVAALLVLGRRIWQGTVQRLIGAIRGVRPTSDPERTRRAGP